MPGCVQIAGLLQRQCLLLWFSSCLFFKTQHFKSLIKTSPVLFPLPTAALRRGEDPALQHPVGAVRAHRFPPQIGVFQAHRGHAVRGAQHSRARLESLLQTAAGYSAWLQPLPGPSGLQQRSVWVNTLSWLSIIISLRDFVLDLNCLLIWDYLQQIKQLFNTVPSLFLSVVPIISDFCKPVLDVFLWFPVCRK